MPMTFEEFQETRFESRDLGAALEMDMGILSRWPATCIAARSTSRKSRNARPTDTRMVIVCMASGTS
jgi:hypothetical protein